MASVEAVAQTNGLEEIRRNNGRLDLGIPENRSADRLIDRYEAELLNQKIDLTVLSEKRTIFVDGPSFIENPTKKLQQLQPVTCSGDLDHIGSGQFAKVSLDLNTTLLSRLAADNVTVDNYRDKTSITSAYSEYSTGIEPGEDFQFEINVASCRPALYQNKVIVSNLANFAAEMQQFKNTFSSAENFYKDIYSLNESLIESKISDGTCPSHVSPIKDQVDCLIKNADLGDTFLLEQNIPQEPIVVSNSIPLQNISLFSSADPSSDDERVIRLAHIVGERTIDLTQHYEAIRRQRQDSANVRVLKSVDGWLSGGKSCFNNGQSDDYPFNKQAVIDAIQRNLPPSTGSNYSSSVGIIDSGLIRGDIFSDDLFLLNEKPNSFDTVDSDWDRYGRNFNETGSISPRPKTADAPHGTQVAFNVFGGLDFLKSIKQGELPKRLKPIKIRIFSLNKKDDSEKITSSDLRTGIIYLASNYSRQERDRFSPKEAPRVKIVNLSVEKKDPDAEIEAAIHRSLGTLFVSAAGNSTFDLGANPMYPASLGGVNSINMITVGAHDVNGRLAPFSNKGSSSVDIVAPGCNLISLDFYKGQTGWESRAKRINGTSFSAPLVSFTMGLLDYLTGGQYSPAQLKQRLIVSSDFVQQFEAADSIRLGAKLNISATLSLNQDILRVGNEVYFGQSSLTSMVKEPSFCANEFDSKINLRTKRYVFDKLADKSWQVTRYFIAGSGHVTKNRSCTTSFDLSSADFKDITGKDISLANLTKIDFQPKD